MSRTHEEILERTNEMYERQEQRVFDAQRHGTGLGLIHEPRAVRLAELMRPRLKPVPTAQQIQDSTMDAIRRIAQGFSAGIQDEIQ